MKTEKHYLEIFFETLSKFYQGKNYKNYKIIVKYYLQENTFSYDIFVFDKNTNIINLLKKPDFESEVYYYWYTNTLKILKDIKNEIKSFKNKIDNNNENN